MGTRLNLNVYEHVYIYEIINNKTSDNTILSELWSINLKILTKDI